VSSRERRRAVASLLLVAAIGLVSAAPASAKQPEAVAIATTGAVVDGTQAGTFLATGAIEDEGTYAFHEDVHHDFAFAAIGAPTFGIVRSLEFFSGQAGTFTLQNTVKYRLTATPGVFAVEGTWAVVSGMGAYADLRGQGLITGLIDVSGSDETFAFEFAGSAHHN